MKVNREQAIQQLQDENLHYPSIYVLRNVIDEENLIQVLNKRAKRSLEFVRNDRNDIHGWVQTLQPPLLWMIHSGGEENVDPVYLKKLDAAACLLTVVYGNRTILAAIARMIFFRCRNQLPYHDLVWAFLEAQEPYSLALIAERLRSKNHKESDCARRILSFIPGIDRKNDIEGEGQFTRFCHWMEENGGYLYYKGETFDTTHLPTPYVTIWPAKYLGLLVSTYDGIPFAALSKKEKRLWKQLNLLEEEKQKDLSGYSWTMRCNDPLNWRKWIGMSIKKQMKDMQGGGMDD